MADSQQAQDAEDKQQEPMPSSDEQSTDVDQSQQVADENQEASGAPAGDSEHELPDGVKERTTREFEKLKEQLRQTKEELLGIKDQVTRPVKQEEEKPLYNPKTGLVDIEALEQLRKDARSAKQELESFKRQNADKEVQSLYEAHPDLNPNSKQFNQEAFDEAEKIWLHSQANPEKYGGRALSQRQAADLAKKGMKPKTKSEDSEKAEVKQQASAEASGKPTQAVARQASEEDMQRLRYGTRVGDKDSMIARMRMIREGK